VVDQDYAALNRREKPRWIYLGNIRHPNSLVFSIYSCSKLHGTILGPSSPELLASGMSMPQIAQILFAHEMRGCSQPVVVIVPRQLSPLPKSRIQRKKPAKFKEFGVYPRSQNATPCPNATKEMCCVRHDLFNHERRGCMSALVNPAEWRPSRAMNAVWATHSSSSCKKVHLAPLAHLPWPQNLHGFFFPLYSPFSSNSESLSCAPVHCFASCPRCLPLELWPS